MIDIFYVDFLDNTAKHYIANVSKKQAEAQLVKENNFRERDYRILDVKEVPDNDIPEEWTEKG